MKRIYILTNFSTYLKSYSPIIVVSQQLQQFLSHGYQPVLIASQGWETPEGTIFEKVETKKLTQVPVSNEPGLDATFEEDVNTLEKELDEIIEDDAVVITHDLIFLPDYTKHNVAARRVAEKKPSVRWLHWIHSATAPEGLSAERSMYGEKYLELLTQQFPNSRVAFPNSYDIPRVARNFSFEEDQIYEVPHSSDITEGMHPLVKRVYEDKELWRADMLMIYPLRLDRGKNAEMNVHFAAACKRAGMEARLVFCDFQSTGDDKVVYRSELKALAEKLDVSREVIFMSEIDDSAQLEMPHTAVLDLFTLSNTFMLPSKSETYSLVAQEAMMRGNFCILNHDFPPMRQIYGDNAIYKQFSGNIGIDGYNGEMKTEYNPSVETYMDDLAKATGYWLTHDKTIKAKTWVRQRRNPHTVFKEYLEPLLYA